MKLVFVGTFCSGKSTIAEDVKRAVSCRLVPEQARRVIAVSGNAAMSLAEVRAFLIVHQLVLEREHDDLGGLTLVDGGIVNNIAHDRVLLKKLDSRRELFATIGHSRYDRVFLCNYADVPLELDGLRFRDSELRRRLDREVRLVLSEMNYEVTLLSGNRKERLQIVLDYLHHKSHGQS